MRVGYFDCFSGAAGDMILGALLHAGCPLEALQEVVARLRLPGVSLSAAHVQRGGLAGVQARVTVDAAHHGGARHLPQILRLIADAGLSTATARRSSAVFRRLAEAEAQVHGTSPERIHFHEVGAADALVDVVGACAGVELLGLERITCSPIPTGHGSVSCEHGILPVPAPATALLLKGVPLAACDEPGELTTPTGAAILTTLAAEFGPPPAMTIASVGYGAGTREGRTRPNVLRLLVGDAETAGGADGERIVVLEAQVDDSTGQAVAYAAESLLAAGALDVFVVPILMKKGRPGQLLAVLSRPDDTPRLEELIFRETTTFGVRRHDCLRSTLAREQRTVATKFGEIRVKLGRRGDRVLQAWPEYEDCAAAARRANVSLREVQQEALRVWG